MSPPPAEHVEAQRVGAAASSPRSVPGRRPAPVLEDSRECAFSTRGARNARQRRSMYSLHALLEERAIEARGRARRRAFGSKRPAARLEGADGADHGRPRSGSLEEDGRWAARARVGPHHRLERARRGPARSSAARPPWPPAARCRNPRRPGRAPPGSARRARRPRRRSASRGTRRWAPPARAGAALRSRARRPAAGGRAGWPRRRPGPRACTAPAPRPPGSSRPALAAGRKRAHVHRRVDHLGVAPVGAADPVGDVARDRHELVDAVRRGGPSGAAPPPAAAARAA